MDTYKNDSAFSEFRNDQIKGCFLEIYKKFIDEVEPNCILDWLIQEKIINIEEKERISSQLTRHEKCRVLLDKLFMTSNKKAFIVTYQVLHENYPWLAEDLDNYMDEKEQDNKGSAAQNSQTLIELENKLRKALTTIEKLVQEQELKNKKISELENSLSNAQNKIKQFEHDGVDNGIICSTNDSAQLYLELNKKTDDIKKLENHIIILQNQIKTAASMNKSNDKLDVHEIEKKMSVVSLPNPEMLCPNGSSGITYNDKHFSDEPAEKVENLNSITRLIKLVNYSGSSFDLWQGAFGSQKDVVIIKELLQNTTEIQQNLFINEVQTIKNLKHPRLCNLINSSIVSPSFFIIYEGSTLPSVYNMLKYNMYEVTSNDIFRWIVQLASGLDYLHSHLIIHRNIFINNLILYNATKSIKLFNFSNVRKLNAFEDTITEELPLMNVETTAPEVLAKNEWSLKTDVWSFGMTAIKLLLHGKKIFPEMTKRDIQTFVTLWSADKLDKFMLPIGLLSETRNTKYVKQCLEYNPSDRPDMSELTFYSKFLGNLIPKFSLTYSFEQTISHKCTVKGMTTLKDMLYVIVVSSSSIKCYKKSKKFERIRSIKLGHKKTKSLTNFLKIQRNNSSSSMDSNSLSSTQITYSSNILTSLASSESEQYLYVLDGLKQIIFQISAEKRRIISSFEACPGAHNISITRNNTILINCKLDENFVMEYNNKGLLTRVVNTDYLNSEPRKAIKLNDVNYLFFHKQKEAKDETFTINVVDNDDVPSSGYGTLCLKNISDVAVHRPTGTIFWTDYNGNRVMFVDRFMNCEPQELLNAENGIFNPVKIYVSDERHLFVGLTSGTIRFFQFQWG